MKILIVHECDPSMHGLRQRERVVAVVASATRPVSVAAAPAWTASRVCHSDSGGMRIVMVARGSWAETPPARHGPEACSAMPIMPKHDHHKAAAHHDQAAKSHRDAAAHEEGDTEKASQHSQIANDHSKKAQGASNAAHQKTKGPKTP
jgi:hypothetical protein